MNQWQQEILKLEQLTDKRINKKLYEVYNEILKVVRAKLKEYMDEYEDIPYYKQQQAGKLSELEKEIVEMLNQAQPKAKFEITEFKRNELEDGYYSTMYQIEQETGARLDFLGLEKDFIRNTVNTPIAGETLSKRLYRSRNQLASRATSELLNGIILGKSYSEIAGAIQRHTEANYKQALRIARTEGGRLRSIGKQASYTEAKDMGIDLQKQWYASLDTRTRSSHQKLDGQTVEIDEKFKYGGYEADGPRLFGKADLDINCRCTTIAIVDGIAPETRIDGYGNEIPYKNYNEWKNDLIAERGQKWWDVEVVKSKNKSRDSVQFNQYSNVLGKEIPSNINEFQDLKYNEPDKWNSIQDHYYIKSRLKDGNWKDKINPEKQARHLNSAATSKKSYFYENVDVEKLYVKYKGTGSVERHGTKKYRISREYIMTNEILGINPISKKEIKGFKIHYSKTGAHLVPWEGE